MNTRTPAKSRAKNAILSAVIFDRHEMQTVASQTAELQLRRDALQIEGEQKIATIKEDYAKGIETLDTQIEENVRRMEGYSRRHRDELFGDKQSTTVAGHKIEFRLSPGKVGTAAGIKQADAVEALLTLGDEEFSDSLLRFKTELDKEAIIKVWDDPTARPILERLGIIVTKLESFSFTPNRDELSSTRETSTTKATAAA